MLPNERHNAKEAPAVDGCGVCEDLLASLQRFSRVLDNARNARLPLRMLSRNACSTGLCPNGKQAAVGFEPTNNGFANRRLRPLGYAA